MHEKMNISIADIDGKAYRDFYEHVGARYPEEETVYSSLRGLLRKKFISEWLRDQKGFLLDMGTGEGIYLREYEGGASLGIDISGGKLKKAKARLPGVKKYPVFFAVADAGCLSCIRPGVFDVILCSEVIEHLQNPESAWTSAQRLLKPGGLALFTCPSYRGQRPGWTELGVLSEYAVDGMASGLYYHAAFNPDELETFARKAGLLVLRKGMIEREVRPSVALPVIFLKSVEFIRRIFRMRPLKKAARDRIIDRGGLLFYRIFRLTGILRCLLPFFRRGVRSYILVQKL